jgi:hypothetical protein
VLYWRELQNDIIYPLISCESPDTSVPTFMFQINSIFPPEAAKGFERGLYPLGHTQI